MTNYERLKNMSVVETALMITNALRIIDKACNYKHCPIFDGSGNCSECQCDRAVLNWLESEVEDDD